MPQQIIIIISLSNKIQDILIYLLLVIFNIDSYTIDEMGCASSNRNDPVLLDVDQTEREIIAQEDKLGISSVKFSRYRAAIKKYGFSQNLTLDHLTAISSIINLNVHELKENTKS